MLLPVPERLRSQADAYLTASVIFIAPVAALPEFLAKYRVHGSNLFHVNQEKPARERIEHRMQMRAVLLAEIHAWLERNGHDLTSPDLQAYLKQWRKAQERDGFELHKPSRSEYFRYLLEYPRIYGDIMSPRHRLYDYIRAFGALALGYDHLHLIDDLRERYKSLFRGSFGGALASEGRKEATTKD